MADVAQTAYVEVAWFCDVFDIILESLNVRATSKVTPSVFPDTVIGQSATVSDSGSSVLDNFCPHRRNILPVYPESGGDYSPRTNVEGQRCKTRGVGGRIWVV